MSFAMRASRAVADFGISPEEPTTDDSVQLFDCSRDPEQIGIAWRAWDFGDETNGVGSAPVHRFVEPGEYEVTLTVATFDGRVTSATQTVRVREGARRREPT